MIVLDSKPGGNEEREPLFSIDGVEYTVPKTVSVGLALKYFKSARLYGVDMAIADVLETVLGSAGYDGLTNYEGLTPEDLAAVIDVVTKKMLGAMDTSGKSEPAPANSSGS
ncbi:MAG: hypothetical protein OJJ54_13485 [Pseudonocardia sp.]|nr:hypothetical protein [Pseudonocardia sp.]